MVKPKSFRAWNPEQTLLLPPSPVDWLRENHLVFYLLDLAAEVDPEEIYAVCWLKNPRVEKAYDPRMMVVLLLYACCVGMSSSRRIEKACSEDAAFRVLTGITNLTTARSATTAAATLVLWLGSLFRFCCCARWQAW
jgi:transposase